MTDVQQTVPTSNDAVVFPTSFAQERLWFLDQLEPGSSAYNVPVVLRLGGELDVAALERAVNALVDRHEALRTTFMDELGAPVQVVHHALALQLDMTDLSSVSESECERAAERAALAESNRPFDLTNGPLIRSALIRLSAEQHILVLTIHHVVTDAWSLGVLRRDLTELYRADLAERVPTLPTLAVQYADYAVWQREWLESGQLTRQLEYWKDALDGAPTLLDLPADRPRPALQSDRGGHCRSQLPRDVVDEVEALAQTEGATPFMVLLAVYATLLSRYSGQRDLVIGVPIANRARAELEDVVGFFTNTIAVRIDLSGNPTFRALLRRVRKTMLGAYANQDLPFERLVSEINPERTLSHTPLFQVLFQLQPSVELGATDFAGLQSRNVELERGRAKFDLGLFMSTGENGLRASIEYSDDLFDRGTVEGMLGHLEKLLRELMSRPDQHIENAPLLTQADEIRLQTWNETAATYPDAACCVHTLVERQVERSPHAVAVCTAGSSLTYAELNDRANQVAWRLRELGLRADTPVAILLERSVELVVATLGVLKAGGAYCPFDPAYPEQRLIHMLEESGAPIVLTRTELADRVPEGAAAVLRIDDVVDAASSTSNPNAASGPDDLAYVLFTSGSTGRPKGVAMPHRALANLLAWQRRNFSFRSDARTLQFASLTFDVGFQEVYSTWANGGTLILVDDDTRRDPRALLRFLDDMQVERLFLPYVALQQLAEAALELDTLPGSLREVITAGEALLATPAIRELFARLPEAVLHNQYGPTESHVVTAFRLDGSPSEWPARPPIGAPIANARTYVLDEHVAPVPVGVPGELYLGGLVLARGYINNADLTAERFVPDPLRDDDARMYRTGDRVRYLQSGDIEFLGRVDEQVKIRGYRVELGEIEAVLLEHEAVREAVVVAHEDGQRDRRLIAYIVSGHEGTTATEELREFVARRLPDFMIPSAFVALEQLPLGRTGKIDRRALPVPDGQRSEAEFVAPSSPTEEAVARIWSDVLAVEPIGATDNFFALGGHSLLATRVVSRLIKLFDVDVGVRDLFEAPTVSGLALVVDTRAKIADAGPRLTLKRADRHQHRVVGRGGPTA